MKDIASEFRAALGADLARAGKHLEKNPDLIDHPVFGRSESALLFYTTENWMDTVRWLLAKGANPNGTSANASPLRVAAQLGHLEICIALIEAGADLNLQDDSGETALHKAACGGHIDIITTLLNAGADASAVDMCGELPVDHALPRKRDQIRAVFEATSPPP